MCERHRSCNHAASLFSMRKMNVFKLPPKKACFLDQKENVLFRLEIFFLTKKIKDPKNGSAGLPGHTSLLGHQRSTPSMFLSPPSSTISENQKKSPSATTITHKNMCTNFRRAEFFFAPVTFSLNFHNRSLAC